MVVRIDVDHALMNRRYIDHLLEQFVLGLRGSPMDWNAPREQLVVSVNEVEYTAQIEMIRLNEVYLRLTIKDERLARTSAPVCCLVSLKRTQYEDAEPFFFSGDVLAPLEGDTDEEFWLAVAELNNVSPDQLS